ncbi:hypothetical protein DFH11DRAFT_1548679 [Phellopilus nigrolimitatus]|nr:hypothetical protein DFH11DRAFT_1548679 [Phellopilus nigrolimitatus]
MTLQESASYDHIDPPGGAREKKRAADDTTNASANTKAGKMCRKKAALEHTVCPRDAAHAIGNGEEQGNDGKDLKKSSGEVEGPIFQLALFHEDVIFFASKDNLSFKLGSTHTSMEATRRADGLKVYALTAMPTNE